MAEERTVKERIRDFLLSRRFHMFLRCMNLILRLLMVVALCVIMILLIPYITGKEEFEDIPMTLSQVEALLCLMFLCYILKKM